MESKEEINLMKLLYEYNPKLGRTYLESTLDNMRRYEKSIKLNNYIKISIPSIHDLCCFRIYFRFPLFFLVSRQISLFRSLMKYYKSDIGFLPAYVPEINEIIIIKTWNNFADSLLGPGSRLPPYYLCYKISKDKEMAELSSMNFILRNDTDWEEEDSKNTLDLVIQYLKFFYWNFPRPGQIMRSAMFYHDFHKIHSVYHVTKTVVIIENIEGFDIINLRYKSLRLKIATIKQLIYSKNGYLLEELRCFVTEEIANNINFKKTVIVNAIITTIGIDNVKHKVLSSLIEIIYNPEVLLTTLIGFIAHERFNLSGDTVIESIEEFEKEVMHIYGNFASLFSDLIIPNPGILFDKYIDNLKPILTCKDHKIYFLHPAFLGFLAQIDRFDLLKESNLLIDMIKLFRYERHDARFCIESDNLQNAGINKSEFLYRINYVNNSMQYSRILKR